ncbi:MAG TPA: sporulation protein [Chitinophagaceae bacterium]|nr:SPOR domain-containing protein [Bacteroidota bacterium]HBB58307.1 sporulation protein [Chitinophagaceae bacterium]
MGRIIFVVQLLMLWASGQPLQAQDSLFIKPRQNSKVSVQKDNRIDLLIKKQIQVNEETSRQSRRQDKGFRLLVISTTLREEALAAKTKVYTYFPELKAYLFHQSPYYRVKAGNFKERKEAEQYQRRLELLFPKGVFIINDIIEVKLKGATEAEGNSQD